MTLDREQEESERIIFDKWWKDYGKDCDSRDYRVAKDAFHEGFLQLVLEVEALEAVIKFLKKELQKKTYCRQVMKRQYREMKAKLYSAETQAKKRGDCYLDSLKELNLYKEFVEHYDAVEIFEAFKEMKQIGEEK